MTKYNIALRILNHNFSCSKNPSKLAARLPSPLTCGLFLLPSEMCHLSAQPVGYTGHLDYSLTDWWRLESARWLKGLKMSYDQTTSRASVASGVLLALYAMLLLQQQYLGAWQPTRYPPCPPGHYAGALRVVSGWRWLDPEGCLPAGAVGLAPCAAALLAVERVPKQHKNKQTKKQWHA